MVSRSTERSLKVRASSTIVVDSDTDGKDGPNATDKVHSIVVVAAEAAAGELSIASQV